MEKISIDEFIKNVQNNLEEFKKYWMENHLKTPENFPLSFNKNNEGLWYEQFEMFIGFKGI